MDNETRDKIAVDIKNLINESMAYEGTESRTHLGASEIGKPCSRELWYGFRKVLKNPVDGRMARLFSRGHREEAQVIEILKHANIEVSDIDPETGRQYRFENIGGHFGGSCDGIATLHDYGIKAIFECKTANDKSFNALEKNGLVFEKELHYTQMCMYGAHFNINWGLYVCVNKNNDDIYIEIPELFPSIGQTQLERAKLIIEAKEPPERITEEPNFRCTFCNYKNLCHFGEKQDYVNCFSCSKATPIDGGEWHCSEYDSKIPSDHMIKGCGEWQSIV